MLIGALLDSPQPNVVEDQVSDENQHWQVEDQAKPTEPQAHLEVLGILWLEGERPPACVVQNEEARTFVSESLEHHGDDQDEK